MTSLRRACLALLACIVLGGCLRIEQNQIPGFMAQMRLAYHGAQTPIATGRYRGSAKDLILDVSSYRSPEGEPGYVVDDGTRPLHVFLYRTGEPGYLALVEGAGEAGLHWVMLDKATGGFVFHALDCALLSGKDRADFHARAASGKCEFPETFAAVGAAITAHRRFDPSGEKAVRYAPTTATRPWPPSEFRAMLNGRSVYLRSGRDKRRPSMREKLQLGSDGAMRAELVERRGAQVATTHVNKGRWTLSGDRLCIIRSMGPSCFRISRAADGQLQAKGEDGRHADEVFPRILSDPATPPVMPKIGLPCLGKHRKWGEPFDPSCASGPPAQ